MAVPGLDPGIRPGHLDPKGAALRSIWITGTRPVTTEKDAMPLPLP
ncbi:hypothetical protein [Microvirga makkahensis]|uniref:Uncharacterized protein n=1 Tax=Microvirga makkahensis TaxID=1128670 RepID=A0A7X3MNQ4_9HYPH|nr:hypothetical protein [Microvirga makkahensis]MXQ10372.1 hypothetical protein [Microvirga makkahensis]